jgi:hypothetical protein
MYVGIHTISYFNIYTVRIIRIVWESSDPYSAQDNLGGALASPSLQ